MLLAIDKFSEIQELVNRSMGLVEQANSTVNNITKKVDAKGSFINRLVKSTVFVFSKEFVMKTLSYVCGLVVTSFKKQTHKEDGLSI